MPLEGWNYTNMCPKCNKIDPFHTQIKDFTLRKGNLCGLEPQLIKLEFIIYLPKLKVSRACRPFDTGFGAKFIPICTNLPAFGAQSARFRGTNHSFGEFTQLFRWFLGCKGSAFFLTTINYLLNVFPTGRGFLLTSIASGLRTRRF